MAVIVPSFTPKQNTSVVVVDKVTDTNGAVVPFKTILLMFEAQSNPPVPAAAATGEGALREVRRALPAGVGVSAAGSVVPHRDGEQLDGARSSARAPGGAEARDRLSVAPRVEPNEGLTRNSRRPLEGVSGRLLHTSQ